MVTTSMNSENSKTSNPQRLWLNLSDKASFGRSDMLLSQILASTTIHGKHKNVI